MWSPKAVCVLRRAGDNEQGEIETNGEQCVWKWSLSCFSVFQMKLWLKVIGKL